MVFELAQSIFGIHSNDAYTGKQLHHPCEVRIVVGVGVVRPGIVKSDCTESIGQPCPRNMTCPKRLSVWCHSPMEGKGTYRARQ